MDEHRLNILVENELYKYILVISGDELQEVTLDRIEEGILWFLLKYEGKIDKNQRKLIIQKIWKMFENKNKHLSAVSKEKYEKKATEIEEIEI